MDYQTVLKDLFGEKSTKNINFTKLGDGANAVALQINGSAYKFWFEDDAYESFIEYVLKNQNNRFLPKLESKIKTLPAFFIRHFNAPDKVKYVKLESLESFKSDNRFEIGDGSDSFNISIIIDEIDSRARVINLSRIDFYSIIFELLSKRTDHNFNLLQKIDIKFKNNFRSYIKDDDLKLFIDTMYDIYLIAAETGSRFDLHTGNFMNRGNVPVILEPLANKDSLKINRFIQQFNNDYITYVLMVLLISKMLQEEHQIKIK